VGVIYDRLADGSLHFDHALADDGTHDSVALSREQVFALDHNRPTFYSEVWSHQLGGHGAHARTDLSYERCYGEGSIRPLPDSVARAFRVDGDDRAPPAHVERTGARRIDFVAEPSTPAERKLPGAPTPPVRGASLIAPVLPRG
jgi:hypothetical protein